MLNEGINSENEFLYDVATLRFKFNEISSNTVQFINSYSNNDCKELHENLKLLQRAINDCVNEVIQNKPSDSLPGTPVKKSTPKKSGEQSEGEDLFFSALDVTPSRHRKFSKMSSSAKS